MSDVASWVPKHLRVPAEKLSKLPRQSHWALPLFPEHPATHCPQGSQGLSGNLRCLLFDRNMRAQDTDKRHGKLPNKHCTRHLSFETVMSTKTSSLRTSPAASKMHPPPAETLPRLKLPTKHLIPAFKKGESLVFSSLASCPAAPSPDPLLAACRERSFPRSPPQIVSASDGLLPSKGWLQKGLIADRKALLAAWGGSPLLQGRDSCPS